MVSSLASGETHRLEVGRNDTVQLRKELGRNGEGGEVELDVVREVVEEGVEDLLMRLLLQVGLCS